MINHTVAASISLAAALQFMWEDANGRRRDEEGKKARTRRGYLALLRKVGHAAVGEFHAETTRAAAAWHTIYNDTCPVR